MSTFEVSILALSVMFPSSLSLTARFKSVSDNLSPTVTFNSSTQVITGASSVSGVSPITNHLV